MSNATLSDQEPRRRRSLSSALPATAVGAAQWLALTIYGVTPDDGSVVTGLRTRYASSFTRSVTRNHASA